MKESNNTNDNISSVDDAVLSFEERHGIGKAKQAKDKVYSEKDESIQSNGFINKFYILALVFLTAGVAMYSSGWNPFEKKWYQDCNSDLMKEGYIDAFKLGIKQQNSSVDITEVELISKPETLDRDPLKCSVRLSYRIDLSIFKYQIGTVTLIRTTTGYDLENNRVRENILLVDDVSEVHSLVNF